jgi:hypothetical protein
MARSNVVPITSRLATAEKLDDGRVSVAAAGVEPAALVVADPFAPSPTAAIAPPAASNIPSASIPAPAALPGEFAGTKRPTNWIAIGMVAAFAAFGAVAAVAVFFRSAAPAPANSPGQAIVGPATGATTAATAMSTTTSAPVDSTVASASPSGQKAFALNAPRMNAGPGASTAAAGGRSLDLHSLTQNSSVAPTSDDPGTDGPKAPGQCFSQGQVQQVIGLHQLAIRRSCWERDPTTKPTVNIGVSLTIGPDGSAQNVSASGDEQSVARCIENDVRGWHFPAMGCSQKTGFSFKFVRQ